MTDKNETRTVYIDSTDGVPEALLHPMTAIQFCIDHIENGALSRALESAQGLLIAYHNALEELGVKVEVKLVEVGTPSGEAN